MTDEKEKWTEKYARFGIYSKGVVYCLIGVLSTMAALGLRSDEASKNEALKVIYDQPFGKILLTIIAFGLFGYVTWRFFQSVYDIDSKGNDTKAKLVRVGYGLSALLYLALGIYALKLGLSGPGGSSGGGDNSRQFIVAKVLSFEFGAWLIGIAALLTIGNGIRQIYKGASGRFMKNVRLTQARYSNLFKKAGTAGYIARGLVLVIIGYFLLRAALYHNPSEAMGTKGAFGFLQGTAGSALVGIVALGLVGYGVFMFVKGRYQKIDLDF